MPAQHEAKPTPVTRRTRHRHFRQALIGMDDAQARIILRDRTARHGATDQIIALGRAPACAGAKLLIKATKRQHQLARQEQVEFNHASPDICQVNRARGVTPAPRSKPAFRRCRRARQHAKRWYSKKGGINTRQDARWIKAVIIRESHDLTARLAQPKIARMIGVADVGTQMRDAHARCIRHQDRHHPIIRILIHDDHFKIIAALRQQAFQQFADFAAAAERCDNE